MSDNIKVVVKVRPLIPREIEEKLFRQWRVKNNTLYQIDQNGKDILNGYTFDKVYDETAKTTDVYNDVAKPIVEAAAAGFNGTIFAYGQTSSGKTYTMSGTDESLGIIPLSVMNLFDIIKNIPDRDYLVRVAYVEIYNETLIDLLNTEKKNIKIHDTLQGVKVDATVRVTTSPEEVLQFMREGQANRQTGSTNMNEESSRSHSIFQITIESREHIEGEEVGCLNVSQLNLVDLAGSERSGQTGATGIRFKEGTHINKSLSSLALVIKQLSEGLNKHVSYRDSRLTRILQNSLGGNAKTSIICAVTPAAVEETISTLQFASRAKAIKNSPEVNVVATDTKMIESLTKQLSSLKTQLENKRNVEEDNHKLQKQIAVLQRFLSGFGQQNTAEMMTGNRRKMQQMRRATISTPHVRQEDPTPSAPRFCTPSLKYNPTLIASSSEFLPIHSMNNLASVPEEPVRLITPPPKDHKTTVNEIIELDSDDDIPSDVQTCSPYHKCFNSSKTPPCVLRKNAIEAEKNFKDLVELTEREKIYTPHVVELIEKLEHSTSVIAKLEENIDILNKLSKENESEIDVLREKINKTEEEVRSVTSAKVQLEARCIEYNTKLTDWEVTYDTLKKKAKTREEELLSRLEEFANVKKIVNTGEAQGIVQIKDTKDISATASDNMSPNIEEHIRELKEQLSIRDKTITELETILHIQNEKVMSLERRSHEIQISLDSCKAQLSKSEDENILHKHTIKTLNNIIEDQKFNLETATNDLQSYNNTIQQLQDELNKKEKLLSITLNDSEIENLIINEDKLIANNENINNIIHSLKTALDSKNKEIKALKSIQSTETVDKEIATQLSEKQLQITELHEKVTKLEQQMESNNLDLKTLLEEKSGLLTSLQQVNDELSEFRYINEDMCNQIKNYESEITSSKERNEELKKQKQLVETEFIEFKTELTSQIKIYLDKINNLEHNLQLKNIEIETLSKNVDESKNVKRVKEIIRKLQDVLVLLTDESKKYSQSNDTAPESLDIINDKFNDLESTCMEVINCINVFKNNLLRDVGKQFLKEIKSFDSEITMLESDLSNSVYHKKNVFELNDAANTNCLEKLNNLNDDFIQDFSDADAKSLLTMINGLCSNLKQKIKNIKLEYISSCDVLKQKMKAKDSEINQLGEKVNHLETKLEHKSQELLSTLKANKIVMVENEEIMNIVFHKILESARNLKLEINLSCDLKDMCDNRGYNNSQILTILDSMVSQFLSKSEQLEEFVKQTAILVDAQKKLQSLSGENVDLIQNLSKVTRSNSDLTTELQEIRRDNKDLIEDLKASAEVLKDLKKELKAKANEIETMGDTVLKWKEQFTELDNLMKKQLSDLQEENTKLRKKCVQLETLQKEYDEDSNNSDINKNTANVMSEPSKCSVINSPLSLLTISCNKIIEIIQENNSPSVTDSTSKSEVDHYNDECSINCFECEKLKDEINVLNHKNSELTKDHDVLKLTNENLLKEIHDAYEEIKDLLACTNDLQKKILNHRTNLSTLTATTYAENKSLSSQVKFLQLHHTRFHTVCQRELPELKEQLDELMKLLKEENMEHKLHNSFKRYSLPVPLDSNSLMYSFKNESTLDGDVLMLDTNLTVTTSADNTITGLDQTCCEVTQAFPYRDIGCQTTSCLLNEVTTSHTLSNDVNIMKRPDMLQTENKKNYELFYDALDNKNDIVMVNAETSPIKHISITDATEKICNKCEQEKEQRTQLAHEIGKLKDKLVDVTNQRDDLKKNYNDLSLEVPSIELLLRKLHNFEKELENKSKEIEKLSTCLMSTKDQNKNLQEENDNLSIQVMDLLSEIDDHKKELDNGKKINSANIPKSNILSENTKDTNSYNILPMACLECIKKDEQIECLEHKLSNTHTRLNRSYSDSDSSSRYNKICTLQNELEAGREDCNELKEEVTTIKNQLESNNLSISQAMDLDESIGDTNAINSVTNKSVMPKITEEHVTEIYNHDKVDCLNYYIEKAGNERANFNRDVKIIDVMKALYNKLMTEHENQIEIMANQLRDYEDSKREIQEKIINVTKELEMNYCGAKEIENKLSILRNNIDVVIEHASTTDAVELFKQKVLMVLDAGFSMNSRSIFETILNHAISKNVNDLDETRIKYVQLEECSRKLKMELESAHKEILQFRSSLSDKENECKLLAAQKAKIHEINNALTMDLINKDKELSETIILTYKKLVDGKLLKTNDVDDALPPIKKLHLLNDRLVTYNNTHISEKEKEINVLKQDIANYKMAMEEKSRELRAVTELFGKTKERNDRSLKDKEDEIQKQKSLYNDLNTIYNTKVEENNVNRSLIQKLTEEIGILKEGKDTVIHDQQVKFDKSVEKSAESESKVAELMQYISTAEAQLDSLKLVNHTLNVEKEAIAAEYEKLRAMLDQNKIEQENMESDILVLKESVMENNNVVDGLKREIATLSQEKLQLKEQLQDKCKELSRLEFNIKTHETTAKIQTKMISRLQKQKDEDANAMNEKDRRLAELDQKCDAFQKECVRMNDCISDLKQELDTLEQLKHSLEEKVTQLESCHEGVHKSRLPMESVTDSSRRRRQSIHDSTRAFDDIAQDHNKAESAPNGRSKVEELMDVDEDSSYRSTPVRLSKGRDSLLSKHEDVHESEEEDRASRSGSATAARRRRRSTHDLQRTALRNTPDGHDLMRSKLRDEPKRSPSNECSVNSTVNELQDRLSCCQQELDELKERYKELDEECETCAEYLRERDEQCARLKKEKVTLEKIITELNEKVQNNSSRNISRANFAHAAVNTDEDWANLHSVVVDRMSFDAEVEKNKRLTRTIEELRFNKQELKIVVTKMQKALEEKTSKDAKELERTRLELHSCREELEDLKRRNKELDEECETCAQYLRERDEQCRRLKEAMAALEAKLQESQEGVGHVSLSMRKKRQTLYDLNRRPTNEQVDASTEISEDLLSRQVERDNGQSVADDTQTKLIKKLKAAIENLTEQKATLEQQLMAAATAPVYVATGSAIVQNQQLTDVMKENRKLKKMNAELITLCKKRGKAMIKSNRENQDPTEEI